MNNDYISIATSDVGRFTIGTTGGNPDNPNDNNKKLLFGHPSPWSSYTTLRIDQSNYTFTSAEQTISGNSKISNYTTGDINVSQVLSIVKNTATNREDTVQVKYIVKNTGTAAHDAGVRIMMDTMLGDNDAAPFRIPNIGAVTTELELSGNNIPEYWQAFDSLTNPSVISQGTLVKAGEIKPDKVQFTNWNRVYSMPWGYSVNPGYSNGDSAVSVIWNPTGILPGEQREYITYYGLSEFVQDLNPPLALSLTGAASVDATDQGYSPNPFTVTAYVQNTGNGPATNVQATLNLPSGLSLKEGQTITQNIGDLGVSQEKQVSWNVYVEAHDVATTSHYSVTLEADQTLTKNLGKDVFIPKINISDKKVVIFIPGMMGSDLWQNYGADNSKKLWFQIAWDEYSKLTNLACDSNGTPVSTNITAVDPVARFYKTAVETLSKDYIVIPFAYDWRIDNNITASKLDRVIKAAMNSYGVDKVSIVAHSMGGLVAAKYIKNGNADKIDKLITIGTPYLGAPKSLYTFDTGNIDTILDFRLRDGIKEIIPNIATGYQLLPTKNYFIPNNYYITKDYYKDIFSWLSKRYKEEPVKGFDNSVNYLKDRGDGNTSLLDEANTFNSNLDLATILKSVDSYFIIGDQNSTIGTVHERYKVLNNKEEYQGYNDNDPVNGDGTVPLSSSTIGFSLDSIHEGHAFYYKATHSDLPGKQPVLDQIKNILNGDNTLADGMRTNYVKSKKLKLQVLCPVDLNIYDSQGNHTGKISDNEYEQNIQSSSYYQNRDEKTAFLPDEKFDVKLVGTGEGKMTYIIKEYDENDKVIKTVRFDDVNITPTTIIKTDTDLNNDVKLNIDDNGDGITDEVMKPSVVLDSNSSLDLTAPSLTVNVEGTAGQDDWYKSDITIKATAADEVSGIDKIQYFGSDEKLMQYIQPINITNDVVNKLSFFATDKNNNISYIITKEIKVDKTAPSIDVNVDDGSIFFLNQPVTINWNANDAVSGISSINASVDNNSVLDTSTIGTKTITITATDKAGNTTSKTITYRVKYDFTKMLTILNNYTMFSGSTNSPLTISGASTIIKGNIDTNKDFIFRGSKLNLDGTCYANGKISTSGSKINIAKKVENSQIVEMPSVINGIRLITKDNADVFNTSKQYNGKEINISKTILVNGDVSFQGKNFKGQGFVVSSGNVNFDVSTLNQGVTNQFAICSENGNITINGSDCEINGILYAPKGTVTINTSSFTLNGTIIADKIILNGSSLNISHSDEAIKLIDK